MLGPLECTRDVLCVPEFWVVLRAPVCNACFSGGFHWFSKAFALWMVAEGW